MQVPQGDTYYFKFTTRAFATGIPTTLGGTPVLSVYEENNLTQITAGVSVTADYDSVSGLNEAAIVATSGNGYEVGKYYDVVITTGTVSSVSVVGEVVGHFRVMPPEDAGAGIPDVNVTHVSDVAEDIATETKQDIIDTNVDQIETAVITNAAGVDIAADIIAVKAETAAIVADTNELQTDDVPGLIAALDAVVDTVKAETALIVADTNELQTDDVPGLIAALDAVVDTVKAETALIVADTNELQTDDYPTSIAALQADLDTLTDARGEPGQGAPAVIATTNTKVDYIYKAWRNKAEQTVTTYSLYNDAATVVDQKATVSDDGTTATKGEVVTGP